MNEYISQLRAEKDNIDATFVHATRLISEEIDRSERGLKYTEVHNDKRTKLQERVSIPIKEHPKFNFVGKLLGPAGNTLKQLQQETGTKMSILGRGSMRDRNKEEELRQSGDAKYAHLKDELHVLVEVFAPAVEAHQRMVHALSELKTYLVPEYEDDIHQQQMQELNQMYQNGEETQAPVRGRGRGRGAPPLAGGRGRGVPGANSLLGTPPTRGAPSARGGPLSRGGRGLARGASRGVVRGAPAGRGAARPAAKPEPLMDRSSYGYEEDYSYSAGYEEPYSYGAEQTYRDPYEQSYSGTASDTQYFEYGHGSGSAREPAYEEYGDSWGQTGATYGKAPVPRAKPEYRSHPYNSGGRGAPRY